MLIIFTRSDRRTLIDTGEGRDEYVPELEQAMKLHGCTGLDQIIITHVCHQLFVPFVVLPMLTTLACTVCSTATGTNAQ